MADKLPDTNDPESDRPAAAAGKKTYGRPELKRLGSLRDMTKSQSHGAPDGRPGRGTGRGGDFQG